MTHDQMMEVARGISQETKKARLIVVRVGNTMKVPKAGIDGKFTRETPLDAKEITLDCNRVIDFSLEPNQETGHALGQIIAHALEDEGVDLGSINTIIGVRVIERHIGDLTPYRLAWGQTYEVPPQ